MATPLKAALLDGDRRDAVVEDLRALVDLEVADKSGLSGGVVKSGYAAVKKVRPGIVPGTIGNLLDEFVDALEPHWAAYRATPGVAPVPDFGAFLAARPQETSEGLLAVTDHRAERSSRPAITTVYAKLRAKAQDNVIEALPRLGRVIEKHAA